MLAHGLEKGSAAEPLSTNVPASGTSRAGPAERICRQVIPGGARPLPDRGRLVMTTARDIMHAGAECIGEHDTLQNAARRMRDLDVGALPICGDDERMHGMITDRDIVTRCIAQGADPATVTAGELAKGAPVTIDSTADVTEVLNAMEEHRIRRLPVTESDRLIGMISEADLARHLPEQSVGQFVEAICAN